MCGIVGYIGNQKATPILLNGLSALEYRGYDSAGIAVLEKNNICIDFLFNIRYNKKTNQIGLEEYIKCYLI